MYRKLPSTIHKYEYNMLQPVHVLVPIHALINVNACVFACTFSVCIITVMHTE